MKFGIHGLGNYLLTMHMVRCLFEQVSFVLLVAWAKYERYIPVWEELLFKFFKHHQFWAFEKKIRIKEMPVLGI